jgi:hypothetical protein
MFIVEEQGRDPPPDFLLRRCRARTWAAGHSSYSDLPLLGESLAVSLIYSEDRRATADLMLQRRNSPSRYSMDFG